MKMQSLYPDLELCRQAFNPTRKTLKFLKENPVLIPELLRWYQLKPFPQDFAPREIEVAFDGVTFLKISDTKTYYYQNLNPESLKDYQPEYSEYFFDGEIGVFHCSGEVLINRTQNLEEIPLFNILPKNLGNS